MTGPDRSLRRKAIPLCLVLGAAAGFVAYGPLGDDRRPSPPEPAAELGARPENRRDDSHALAAARTSCRIEALDAFIENQRSRIAEEPSVAESWRVLAEAYLERSLCRGLWRGMAVGRPVYDELPEAVRQDLDLGDAALRHARELGDASSESYRIEAALLGGRITGFVTAFRLRSSIATATDTAIRLDPRNARARIAVACGKLFAPIGGDPTGARRDFLQAAKELPIDERPLLFAAMAAHVAGDSDAALASSRDAATRNPANPFAAEVLRRLEAGEADPFGRDLDQGPK